MYLLQMFTTVRVQLSDTERYCVYLLQMFTTVRVQLSDTERYCVYLLQMFTTVRVQSSDTERYCVYLLQMFTTVCVQLSDTVCTVCTYCNFSQLCVHMRYKCSHSVCVYDRVLYGIFLPGGEIRFYVFLNMYSLLCFPLVLLLSFIWQWFSKCKSETVFIYILMFSVHVVIKFPPLYKILYECEFSHTGVCACRNVPFDIRTYYPGLEPLYECGSS